MTDVIDPSGERVPAGRTHRLPGARAEVRTEVGAAQFAAMVAGLNAVVWERDPGTWQVRYVNDRIVEVLGYPAAQWRSEPDLWSRVLHPDDRDDAEAAVRRATAATTDFSLEYRARAADGRLVWLHHLGHVAVDDAGRPRALHAVLIDVTAQRRREQAATLSAVAGRLLARAGPLPERLRAVADLVVGEVCDQAAVWLQDDDGRHRAVAASPPDLAASLLALAPVLAPPEVRAAYETGQPLVVPEVTEEMLRYSTDDEEHYAAAAAAVRGPLLIMPLAAPDGPLSGVLTLGLTRGAPRPFGDDDLALAADLGQRIATTVAAELSAQRQRRLHALTVALSAAGTVAEAASELADGVQEVLAAAVVTVCALGADGQLHTVRAIGYPQERLGRFATMRLSAPTPLTTAARTRQPVWLPDRAAWAERFPALMPVLLADTEAGAALPLLVGDRLVGAVGVSFRTPRTFDPQTRAFLITLTSQAAVAFERAALADVRGEVAEILQQSLLPRGLPTLERLAVDARYLPGVRGTQAGGDWYDVLQLDDGRIALVTGDVVGEGAAAAAVMGQLRSALATVLLDGHGPAHALELLDRFAVTVPGAQVSTAVCMLLDPATGALTHSSAGHPPPLLVADDGVRFLSGGAGPALGLPDRAPRTEVTEPLRVGATLLLYTDGLVERRESTLDEGMDRLAEVAGRVRAAAVPTAVETVLDRMLGGEGPSDDVAVVVARLLPPPVRIDVPAEPGRLRTIRAAVREWAAGAVLDADTADDLLLAVGEAAANAVEHAYPEPGGGRVRVEVRLDPPAEVAVTVTDDGTWRAPPVDPGFRGRGLQLVRELTRDVAVDPGPRGTVVRFRLPVSDGGTVPAGLPRDAPDDLPAALVVSWRAGGRRVELTGDLDLAGVVAVRERLLAALTPGGPAVTLDLGRLGALASSGLGLLLEAARRRDVGMDLAVVLPASGPARRLLDMTGLTEALDPRA